MNNSTEGNLVLLSISVISYLIHQLLNCVSLNVSLLHAESLSYDVYNYNAQLKTVTRLLERRQTHFKNNFQWF